MKLIIERIIKKYNSSSIENKTILIIFILGIIFSVFATTVNIVLKLGIQNIFGSAFIGVLSLFLLMIFSYGKDRSGFEYFIVILLTVIIYPYFWFFNGGTQGPTPYFFIFNTLIIAIFSNKLKIYPVIILNFSVFISLFIIEYKFPERIIPYNLKLSRFIDIGITYILISLFILVVLIKVMTEYNNKIKELNLSRKKLEKLATVDSLSGLYNRRYAMDKLNKNVSSMNNEFSIIMIDIDNFKIINDSYGHSIGDDVIITIGNTLKDNLRSSDIISRIGGEEYFIILEKTNEQQAKIKAENIRKTIENLKWFDSNLNVTVSLGVYTPKNHERTDEVMKIVDEFLYIAKNNGKNKVVSEDIN